MQYGKIAGIEKKISRLIQGTMMVNDKSPESLEKGFEILDMAVSLGCNAFDTAHGYGGGGSERGIGKWMQTRGNREDIVILDKGCHPYDGRKRVTPEDLRSDLNESLERLQTDYVDMYVLHRDDPVVEVGPIVEELNRHLAAGRIKAFGGSNWTHQRVEAANEYAEKHNLAPFTVSSPNYSLARQVQSPWGDDCVTISGDENRGAREWYASRKMPLLTWSSIARGFFSGRYDRSNYKDIANGPDESSLRAYCHEENFQRLDRVAELASDKGVSIAQIALAYVMSQPLDIFALVGCYTREEFSQCVEASNMRLSPEECAWLNLEVNAVKA
ncbi:MAG: aldo/keto reductase [Planctomycetes bacterium]|nr:aldo/keto reductase [Planctomycetota bacterium]